MASFFDPSSTLSSPAPVQSPAAQPPADLSPATTSFPPTPHVLPLLAEEGIDHDALSEGGSRADQENDSEEIWDEKIQDEFLGDNTNAEPEPREHKLGEILSLIQQAGGFASKCEMSYLLVLKKQIWSLIVFFEAYARRLGSESSWNNSYLFGDEPLEPFEIPFLVQELVEMGDYFAEFKSYTEERDVNRDLVVNWPFIPKKKTASIEKSKFDVARRLSISSDNKQDTTLLTSSRKRSSGNTDSCSHQAGSKMRRGEAEKRLLSSQVVKEIFYLLLDKMEKKLNYMEEVSSTICNHILNKLAIEETVSEVLFGFGNKIDGFYERLVDKCKSSKPNIECYIKVLDDCLWTIFQLDSLMVDVGLHIGDAYDAIEYAPITGDHSSSVPEALDALRLFSEGEQEIDAKNIIGASEGRICKLDQVTENIAKVLEEMRAGDSITPVNHREELLLKDILRHVSVSINFLIYSKPYEQQRDTTAFADEILKELTREKLITDKDYFTKAEVGRDRLFDIAGDISDFAEFLETYKSHLQREMSYLT